MNFEKSFKRLEEIIKTKTLPDPLNEFPDLYKIVKRIKKAIKNNETIAICGDYDADGMTSTALLLKSLKALKADVSSAIPNRVEEGYGLNSNIVRKLAKEGTDLIITVDNGVKAYSSIKLANELGCSPLE